MAIADETAAQLLAVLEKHCDGYTVVAIAHDLRRVHGTRVFRDVALKMEKLALAPVQKKKTEG